MEGLKTKIAKDHMLESATKKYCWGIHDCMTFITRYHDAVYNTNTTSLVENKYSNKRDALKYLRTVDRPDDWLPRNNYTKVEFAESGDILIRPIGSENNYYAHCYIFLNGLAYNINDAGLVGLVPKFKHTIWRHQ
tara:strand:+ start:285 stop:689 length:405 start_codon:yes stop_codon:yes gene_type:complete